jgi:hypothetical protein
LRVKLAGASGVRGAYGGRGRASAAGTAARAHVLPTNATAYLRAALALGADGIGDVEIDLVPAPNQAEDIASPPSLALADLPRTSSADATRLSRYATRALRRTRATSRRSQTSRITW